MAQLLKTDPKDLGNLYKKCPLKRAEAAHSREVIIQVNVLQINSMAREFGKSLRDLLLSDLVHILS